MITKIAFRVVKDTLNSPDWTMQQPIIALLWIKECMSGIYIGLADWLGHNISTPTTSNICTPAIMDHQNISSPCTSNNSTPTIMDQQDIKVKEIDDPINYHRNVNNFRSPPNDIDVPIRQVDVTGGLKRCPTCNYRPSSHLMLTRKKKLHQECIKNRK